MEFSVVDSVVDCFACVLHTSQWPKDYWTLLLQCVLVGKAQEAYSAPTPKESTDYDVIKTTILHAYELEPTAYRQRFRGYSKHKKQNYVEFSWEK